MVTLLQNFMNKKGHTYCVVCIVVETSSVGSFDPAVKEPHIDFVHKIHY